MTVFCVLLKKTPVGCKDAATKGAVVNNHSAKCLNFEENTRKSNKDILCLSGSLGLNLHGNETLEEETSKLTQPFPENTGGTDVAHFRGVCTEDVETLEDNV